MLYIGTLIISNTAKIIIIFCSFYIIKQTRYGKILSLERRLDYRFWNKSERINFLIRVFTPFTSSRVALAMDCIASMSSTVMTRYKA